MNPLPHRPEWAATRTFPAAWRAATELRAGSWGPFRTTSSDWEQQLAGHALDMLARSRVIVIPQEQLAVLPETTIEEAAEVLAKEQLPFDPLYLDLDFTPGDRLYKHQGQSEWLTTTAGILLATNYTDDAFCGPAILGFDRLVKNGQISLLMPPIVAGSSAKEPRAITVAAERQEANWKDIGRSCCDLAARCLRFLASSNVLLEQISISRQVRRAAERRDGKIALTIQIRQPRRASRDEQSVHRAYSHRWEVRGHYKCFPTGTRLADAAPEKLSWDPARQQYVRRIWCPPFVKGPADRPLVPKRRVLSSPD